MSGAAQSPIDPIRLAEMDGYEAFVQGDLACDNPFKNAELRDAWRRGWEEARAYHETFVDNWLMAP